MGTFGAHMASTLFFVLGAGAFTLPVLAFGLGIAGILPSLAYLRSWRSALGIAALLCVMYYVKVIRLRTRGR